MYTREEILGMVAGRRLDAEVAEKVMGWHTFSPVDQNCDHSVGVNGYRRNFAFDPTDDKYKPIPLYCTDIAAAWEVVEKLNDRCAFEVGRAGDICAPDDKWRSRFGMSGWVEAETASEAISKAALLSLLKED